MSEQFKIKAEDADEFSQLVFSLNALIARVRSYVPNANYYLQEDQLHILSGDSHDKQGRAHQDRSMVQETLRHSGGGAW